jgi:hypothetical protein
MMGEGISIISSFTASGDALLDANMGNVSLDAEFNMLGNADLIIQGDNITQPGNINSEAGDILISSANGIAMNAGAQTTSSSGAINYQAELDVQVGSLDTQSGDITVLSSLGRINDANGNDVNFSAVNLRLESATGIGDGNALETRVASMNVVNITSGQVDLIQNGRVDLIALQNTGNSGDITFVSNDDIYFYPGSVNSSLGTGNLLMNTSQGSYFGIDGDINIPTITNPDITAQNATFIGRSGTFGNFQRFLTLNVPGSVLIDTRGAFNPRFVPPGPESLISEGIDFTVLGAISAVAGEQLVEVETLGEIDPAIFTELKNYSLEEISIRMPRDQLFEDELENYGLLQ